MSIPFDQKIKFYRQYISSYEISSQDPELQPHLDQYTEQQVVPASLLQQDFEQEYIDRIIQRNISPNFQFDVDNRLLLIKINDSLTYKNIALELGIAGFIFFLILFLFSSQYNVYASIFGTFLGFLLSVYIGYHIKINITKKIIKTDFDLYIHQYKILYLWYKTQCQTYKNERNNLRFVIERALNQMKIINCNKKLDQKKKKKLDDILKKFTNILFEDQNQEALILSLDLVLHFMKNDQVDEFLKSKVQSLIVPFFNLLEYVPKELYINSKIYYKMILFSLNDQLFQIIKSQIEKEDKKIKNILPIQIARSIHQQLKDEMLIKEKISKYYDLILYGRINRSSLVRRSTLNQPIIDSQIKLDIQGNQNFKNNLIHLQSSPQIMQNQHPSILVEYDDEDFDDILDNVKQNDHDEYNLQTLKQFESLQEYYEKNNLVWNSIMKNTICNIFKTSLPNNPCILLKAITKVQNTTINILKQLILEQKYRQEWDNVTSSFQILETIDDLTDICYYIVKSPNSFLVAHRSFCQIRQLRYNFPKKGKNFKKINQPCFLGVWITQVYLKKKEILQEDTHIQQDISFLRLKMIVKFSSYHRLMQKQIFEIREIYQPLLSTQWLKRLPLIGLKTYKKLAIIFKRKIHEFKFISIWIKPKLPITHLLCILLSKFQNLIYFIINHT